MPKVSLKSPLYDNASRRASLCWCDNWRQHWTELHFNGLKCGLFRIALHLTGRAAMQLVVLNLTEQDCVVLDSKDWSGRDGTELLRIALLCTAMDCTRIDCCWVICIWALLDWNVLSWNGINGIGRERTKLDFPKHRLHSVDWTARQRSGLDWT